MKQLLICLSLLVALTTSAQKNFYTLSAVGGFGSDLGTAYGAEITGNVQLVNHVYGGFGVGVVKYKDLRNVYLPLTGKLTVIPSSNLQKPFGFAVLQPGYGYYSASSYNVRNYNGGFHFYGGLGIAGAIRGGQISVGYSSVSLGIPDFEIDRSGNIITTTQRHSFAGFMIKAGFTLN